MHEIPLCVGCLHYLLGKLFKRVQAFPLSTRLVIDKSWFVHLYLKIDGYTNYIFFHIMLVVHNRLAYQVRYVWALAP